MVKSKKGKNEKSRERANQRYQIAVNFLHLLIYEKKSKEVLYSYSSPGLKLTSYLTNSILQSLNMYANMPLDFQEIYLQEVTLTLTDGTLTTTAVISKQSPSIQMQKYILRFIDNFEERFKHAIPEVLKNGNIINVSRLIDLEFADTLIEDCFQKSLIFPHIAQRPSENVALTAQENTLHKLAYNLNEKSGPFLLGRLLSKDQIETNLKDLPELIDLVFHLRLKEALKPIPPTAVDKLRDKMLREKLNQTKRSEKKSDQYSPESI